MRVLRRHFLVWTPTISLFRWLLFVDHVDLAAPRAPGWWTTVRPRKGTTRSLEDAAVDAHSEGSTWVDCFGYGVRLLSPENNRRCG